MKARALTPAARWLRHARDKLRISRKALAIAAGVSPGTLRNAEQSRHKISRQTAERLIHEITQRDAILARSAPPPLKAAALSQQTDAATFQGPPLAHLRLHPGGPRALLQLEFDPRAVRELVATLRDLLALSQRTPGADLPALHWVLIEKKGAP